MLGLMYFQVVDQHKILFLIKQQYLFKNAGKSLEKSAVTLLKKVVTSIVVFTHIPHCSSYSIYCFTVDVINKRFTAVMVRQTHLQWLPVSVFNCLSVMTVTKCSWFGFIVRRKAN